MLFIIFIIIIHWSSVVESTHFYGGTVTWKPMSNIANGSTIPIMFTQSYQWRRSFSGAGCNQSTILNQSPMIPGANDKLSCTTTGSSCGRYTAISINEYCTDFSALVDSSSGQISTVQNITVGSQFCVAYQGSAWIRLYTTNCGSSGRKRRWSGWGGGTTTAASGCYSSNAGWSIGTCIDLTIRSDGFINTPPVATIISPIKVPVNSLTDIQIPVIDADNDYLRCRWAESTTELDECGDVCQAAPGSILDEDNCTLTFNSTGKNVGDYFAVTLMVEDFYNSTSDTGLSRVPIQFLIYIVGQTNCTSKPTISSTLRLFRFTFQRDRQKEDEQKMTSKYIPFNESLSHNQNRSSSKHYKSNKVNKISAFNPADHLSQRSRTMTLNSYEYHTDQNLNLNTTINEIKSRKAKTSNDVHAVRKNQLNKSFSLEDNTNTRTSIAETNDVSNVNLSKVSGIKLREDTIDMVSPTPSIHVIKVPKGCSSSRQDRNESLSASSKGTHNQSNELKPNRSTNITITKIKRLDYSSDMDHNHNVMPKQPAVIIPTPMNTSSTKFQRNRSHTNTSSANVTVTKLARRKSRT